MNRHLPIVFFLLFFLCNTFAYSSGDAVNTAEEQEKITTIEDEDIGVTSPINFPRVTKIMESLGIIIIIIVVMMYFLRKKLGIKTSINKKKRYISIIETSSLGAKRYLYFIKIPGKLLLIGASNEKMQTLAEITEKEVVDSVDTEVRSGEFMKFFKNNSER
ncbi:MAG: flagellar biosynthetic protein FliO [Candidatus Kuenenia sp.]|nr:flagellar biosynthetic protein FliO [Candidatus Kuenenia hertensis]